MGIEQFRIFFWRKKTPPPTIWPPMNPRWVRSETIFDDETLTTAEGNGMQWAGQWSGYYPPTLCKLCNYVLGKLFVRFFYAVDDRGITHQPLTKLCKISFWGNYLSDFSRQCIMLPTNLWQFRSTLCKQNVWGSISFQTHQEKIHQTKTNDPIFQV